MKHLLRESKTILIIMFLLPFINNTAYKSTENNIVSNAPRSFELNVDNIENEHEIIIISKVNEPIILSLSGEMLRNSPQYVDKNIANRDFNITKTFSITSQFTYKNGKQSDISIGKGTYKITPIKTGELTFALKLLRTKSTIFNPQTVESNTTITLRFKVDEAVNESPKESTSEAVLMELSEPDFNQQRFLV
jgi:hypothetical protein